MLGRLAQIRTHEQVYAIPWFMINTMGGLAGLLSPLAKDMMSMFNFFLRNTFVSDIFTVAWCPPFSRGCSGKPVRWAKEKGLKAK